MSSQSEATTGESKKRPASTPTAKRKKVQKKEGGSTTKRRSDPFRKEDDDETEESDVEWQQASPLPPTPQETVVPVEKIPITSPEQWERAGNAVLALERDVSVTLYVKSTTVHATILQPLSGDKDLTVFGSTNVATAWPKFFTGDLVVMEFPAELQMRSRISQLPLPTIAPSPTQTATMAAVTPPAEPTPPLPSPATTVAVAAAPVPVAAVTGQVSTPSATPIQSASTAEGFQLLNLSSWQACIEKHALNAHDFVHRFIMRDQILPPDTADVLHMEQWVAMAVKDKKYFVPSDDMSYPFSLAVKLYVKAVQKDKWINPEDVDSTLRASKYKLEGGKTFESFMLEYVEKHKNKKIQCRICHKWGHKAADCKSTTSSSKKEKGGSGQK